MRSTRQRRCSMPFLTLIKPRRYESILRYIRFIIIFFFLLKHTTFQTISDENYLVYLVFTILKCAELSEKSKEALEVTTELFKDAYDHAQKKDRLQSVRNFFAIQLGLLKCEDKRFKPRYNVQGCRHALKSVLTQNIVPTDEKNIFEFLLEQQAETQ